MHVHVPLTIREKLQDHKGNTKMMIAYIVTYCNL